MIITIDGPAGTGKSSVAKELATRLDFYYLNTGLLYRAIAFIWLKENRNFQGLDNLKKENLVFIDKINYEFDGSKPNIFYNEKDITDVLNDSVLSNPASILSAQKKIRIKLLPIQRMFAKKYDIITDGRDCGSVVYPNADYKFYLTASLQIRAKRVLIDKKRIYIKKNLEEVKVELEKRDVRDKTRNVAPLIVLKDSIIIDNSYLSFNQTIEKFLSYIK